ncbi:Transcription factor WhiB [Streptomyces sp. SolWspMP-sol7th]|uniref:WhiB family transcriptional regulator n=1 Tax=Streptomyces sp. SolWspMP-sol7th TaxID=1839776 RepID=UPI00081EF1B6|nr:WhiB family transcriptional regulator [Streptomyces sp. SolWspMP-sol7th]SCD86052.1 Transcription factor WhiB [Streptomyces sp. SolWspMP-sol7th]
MDLSLLALPAETWTRSAACLGLPPEVVFARHEKLAAPALRACARCPVTRECEEAVDPGGHWFDGVCGGRRVAQRAPGGGPSYARRRGGGVSGDRARTGRDGPYPRRARTERDGPYPRRPRGAPFRPAPYAYRARGASTCPAPGPYRPRVLTTRSRKDPR